MKRFLVFLILALAGLIVFGSLIEEIQKRGVLRIGQDEGYMPLYGTNEKGERVGLEIELITKMAEILGVKVEFVIVNWDGIIPALLSGKFDMIFSGMTITPERALKVNFSLPYLTVGQAILYNKSVYKTPPTYEELSQKQINIAVQLGTTGEFTARRMFPKAKILTFSTMDEAAFQVVSKRAEIMVNDSIYVKFLTQKYDTLGMVQELLSLEDLGIAIRKGDLETLRWLDTFVQWARTTGLIDELYRKWLETE
ncbi:transporter substrate-binding domain-containing protein [Pseudothermotoga sp. U03pept]|uniref:transporter substrate-binding domain-containing protein n=1 Tax=Pseudothermotoga sp. U03pept TaxID=3447012 RepID=UPI003F077F87